MSGGRQSALRMVAVTGWTTAVVGGLSGLALRVLDPAPIIENTFGMGSAGMVAFVVLGIAWATVGAILIVRRPGNVVGRWVLLVGVGYAISILTAAAASSAVAQNGADDQLVRMLGWLTGLSTLMGGGVFYLAFVFPTGHGHTPRWDLTGRVLLGCTIGTSVLLQTQPGPLHLFPSIDNPFGVGLDLRPLLGQRIAPLITLGVAVFAPVLAAALVSRYRAGSLTERLQLRWFAWSVVLTMSTLATVAVAGVNRTAGFGEAPLVAFALTGTTVPIAIGIAILRHHLYDIDRIISRTVSWAAVSAVLVVTYASATFALQAALAGYLQGQTLAVAASTLVVFALFQPVRRRVQDRVDRRFDRTRYDADQVLAGLGERLSRHVDLDTLSREVREIASDTVRPASSAVWIRRSP